MSTFPIDAVVLLVVISAVPLSAALVLLLSLSLKAARRFGVHSLGTKSRIEGKWPTRISGAILSVYAVCFAYGALIETQWVECTKTEIQVPEPVLGHERFRIVQLSDLHMTRKGRLEDRVIELVRELEPHLVVITGDYASGKGSAASVAEMILPLNSTYGTFGVIGNNDRKLDVGLLQRLTGIGILRDEFTIIRRGSHSLCIVGQDVPSKISLGEILRERPQSTYTIYLYHKPDAVDELDQLAPDKGVDLLLCGHTHGGQVCLPFWGAIVTESKYHKKYERGLYDVRGVPMYVNRGIGAEAVPVRFLARPEVAVIDLVFRGQLAPPIGRQPN